MYKIYFKQAIRTIRQNAFISVISMIGTALAIMMIMAVLVTDRMKTVNLSPENHRDRTLYITTSCQIDTSGGRNSTSSTSLSYRIITDYIGDLETPELVSFASDPGNHRNQTINRLVEDRTLAVTMRRTDDNFWKLFSYRFTEGQPYTREEVESGNDVAILTEKVAKTLFKNESPIGKNIEYNFRPYRVVGVVKEVSPVFSEAYGELFLPMKSGGSQTPTVNMMILARSKKDFTAIRQEVEKNIEKFHQLNAPKFLRLDGPQEHAIRIGDYRGSDYPSIREKYETGRKRKAFIFILLLLVPAVNLSGFSFSRIKKRMPEIGVRKAFGAKKYVILIQVLYENMITSLIGGFTGLALSYLLIFRLKEWLILVPSDSDLPVGALISPYLLLAVFVICTVINLLSAGIPAYRASRAAIVNSLTNNETKK